MLENAPFDVVDDLPRPRIVLPARAHSLEMLSEPLEMVVGQAADGAVGGFSRPKVRWLPAGNAWHGGEGRHPERLVVLDDELRPSRHVGEELIELGVKSVRLGNLAVRLLDLLHEVD